METKPKKKRRFDVGLFSYFFIIIIFLLFIGTMVAFLLIPELTNYLGYPGSIMYVNNLALGEKNYVYTVYGKLLAWIFISLLPLIITVFAFLADDYGNEILYNILFYGTLVVFLALDICLYAIPTSPLRILSKTSEFNFFENTMILRYIGRFFNNFSSVYFYYALFPTIQLLAFFLLADLMLVDSLVFRFFLPFIFIIVTVIGTALIIAAVILLSLIGMVLAIAVFAIGGEKVFENVGSGSSYVGTASDGKKVYYNGSFNVDEDGVHRYGDTHYKD